MKKLFLLLLFLPTLLQAQRISELTEVTSTSVDDLLLIRQDISGSNRAVRIGFLLPSETIDSLEADWRVDIHDTADIIRSEVQGYISDSLAGFVVSEVDTSRFAHNVDSAKGNFSISDTLFLFDEVVTYSEGAGKYNIGYPSGSYRWQFDNVVGDDGFAEIKYYNGSGGFADLEFDITNNLLGTSNRFYADDVYFDTIKNFKNYVVKAHRISSYNTTTTDFFTVKWDKLIENETLGNWALSSDSTGIIVPATGVYQFFGCIHAINNGGSSVEAIVCSYPFVDNDTARCGQTQWTFDKNDGQHDQKTYNGTIRMMKGDEFKLNVSVDDTDIDFGTNSCLPKHVSFSVNINKISD